MATSLETLLADRGWILADGATGTNLFNMGLASGEAPELWNETEPGKSARSTTVRSTPAATSSSPTASAATPAG